MLDTNEILQIVRGIDEHLRKFEALMDMMKEVKDALIDIKNNQEQLKVYSLERIRRDQQDLLLQLKKHGLPESSAYEKELNAVREAVDSLEWPSAVPDGLICGDDEARINERAEGIFEMLVSEPVAGRRFLDYGCGGGHTTMKAVERRASFALGYDIDLSKCRFDRSHFTNDFNTVAGSAPYDIILAYDVLDHIQVIDPIRGLAQMRSVLAPGGTVYLTNHPWSSRHGGHLYTQKNKAFLHLVLDDIELTRCCGVSSEHNVRVVTPLETYRHWITQAGFEVVGEFPIRSDVEEFFLRPSPVTDRLRAHFKEPETMAKHLEINFVEYVLRAPGLSKQIL